MKKIWWLFVVVVVLVAAGYFTYRARAGTKQSSTSNLQTTTVTRGTVAAFVNASGTSRSKQNAVVAWQANGKVGNVSVNVGDQVQANQVLEALDPGSLSPALISAEQTLINAKKTLSDLQASNLPSAQAQQALVQAQKALSDAQAKRAGLNAHQVGTQADITQAKTSYLEQQNTVATAQRHYDHVAHLPTDSLKKAQGQSTLAAAQQKLSQDVANYNALSAPATTQDIALADAAVTVAQAQLKDAQTQWDKVKNGASADDVNAAQAAVDAAQATLAEQQITSPFTGTVTEISTTVGNLVSPGSNAIRIDDLSGVYVDVQVAEVDLNNIHTGQPVNLSFDAIPNHQYTGQVAEIGMVGTNSQGVVNFPVTVQITNPDEAIRPGMTATVRIVVGQHDNVLTVPNRAIQVSGGQRTVTVLFEGQQIQVPVMVGLTNDTTSEVTSDQLKEGDEVVINSTAAAPSNAGGPRGFFGGLGR